MAAPRRGRDPNRGRGRQPGFKMTEEHRLKIAKSNILKYMIECAEGKREMGATQASVAVALLKKVMPDLSTTTLNGDGENPIPVVHRIELVAGGNSSD